MIWKVKNVERLFQVTGVGLVMQEAGGVQTNHVFWTRPPIICGPGATPVCMAGLGERETMWWAECWESLDIDPEWLMLTDGMIVASDDAQVRVTCDSDSDRWQSGRITGPPHHHRDILNILIDQNPLPGRLDLPPRCSVHHGCQTVINIMLSLSYAGAEK